MAPPPEPSAESKAVERVARALASAREQSALGAFWALDERAPAAAARVDAGAPLAGMPIAVKDLVDQRGLPTTAGLRTGAGPAAADAEVVRRLRRAGAVPIGKTAMDPLGCTTNGQALGFPPCVNPLDAGLSPGGSSSGSAVAVAAGIVPLALGTDTAGSVRVPAAYCGVVGFKPWRRSLPRRGITRVMPGFDAPGLLAESVALVARVHAALTGRMIAEPAGTLRVAVLGDVLEHADPVVAGATEGALGRLAGGPIVLETVELSWEPKGFGEALAFELAQVWGARVTREPERFNEVIRESVAFGQTVGERRYRDAIASFAAARTRLRRRLGRFDALLTPTVPVPAPRRDDENVGTSTAFTRIFNALDWPAISVPVPAGGAAPVALEVAGLPTRLDRVFAVAAEIEAAA